MRLYIKMKKFNVVLKNDISRNYSQNFGVAMRVIFESLGAQMTPACPAG